MKSHLLVGLLCLLVLTGCDLSNLNGRASNSANNASYIADYEASQKKLREQQADYDKHAVWVAEQEKRHEALTALQEANVNRNAKILDKWEQQAKRMDAVLDKMEASRTNK